MIKKIVFTLFACLLIQSNIHSNGFFNKAARGLYYTTKWGLIATPLAIPVMSKLWIEYLQKKQPAVWKQAKSTYDTVSDLEKHSLPLFKEILCEHQEELDLMNTYVKELGSKILNVSEEKILVKADICNATTFHAPLVKDDQTYRVIHLGFGDDRLNIFKNLIDYVKHNKPTCAPFIIIHELAHAKFDHGLKKRDLTFTAIIGGYIGSCLLLKRGSLLALTKHNSTLSIMLKTALTASLPPAIYTLYSAAHNALSRKFEWEADNFAISQIDNPEILEDAARVFDICHEDEQKTGIFDPSHPAANARAQNLRNAAARLRAAQSKS